MGKQIEFFLEEKDEVEFLSKIIESGDKIIDDNLTEFTIGDVVKSNKLSLYIFSPQSKIVNSQKGFIDIIASEGIHYSRAFKNSDKVIEKSRIWVEMKYYDKDRQLKTKSNLLEESFEKYRKWIKKNFIISNCKHYYIGKYAFELFKEQGYILKAGPKYFVEVG